MGRERFVEAVRSRNMITAVVISVIRVIVLGEEKMAIKARIRGMLSALRNAWTLLSRRGRIDASHADNDPGTSSEPARQHYTVSAVGALPKKGGLSGI